jgi:glycosyltransferase involved in cell wall biosynthesis
VIIPAYRAEKFLAETLDSVLAQTVSDLECIVVDDGSDDGTSAVIDEYARSDTRVRGLHQPNAGPSVARNTGLAACAASAEYVVFLDADDIWEVNAVELLIGALEADPAAGGAHGLARFIDGMGAFLAAGDAECRTRTRLQVVNGRIVSCPVEAPTTFAALLFRYMPLTPGNLLARRELVARIGGFDPALHGNEDWDVALRLSVLAHLAFVNRPVIRHRRHPLQHSQSPNVGATYERERVAMLRKLDETAELSDEQRRLLHLADRCVDAAESRLIASYARASLRARRWGNATGYARHALAVRIKGRVRPALSRARFMATRRAF